MGGEHLHWLFGIPVESASFETTGSFATLTINALANRPIRAAFLKRLDCLFFDEIGEFGSTHLAVMDIVLENIRGIDQPFGGILIFSTGDPHQLKLQSCIARISALPLLYCCSHIVVYCIDGGTLQLKNRH